MSKKKRRYEKRASHCKKQVLNSHKDVHHLLWYARDYNYGIKKELRQFWYCKILIPKDTLHREIHQKVKCIPPPKDTSARLVLNELKTLYSYGIIREENSIERRLEILIMLFEPVEPTTANALKKELEAIRRFYNPP